MSRSSRQHVGRTRLLAAPVAMVAAASLLAACGGSSVGHQPADATAGPVVRGGDLVIDGYADVPTLDKDKAAVSNEAIRIDENILARLYELDGDGKPAPSLATGHTLSSDKLTWTFTLRDDAKFSNGSPVTAADVVFSLNLARKGIYFGSLYTAIKSVEAPDEHTVVIKTSEKAPTLLDVLTLFTSGIIPDGYAGKSAEEFWKSPVGSGAWKVSTCRTGTGCTVVPNPHHWGPKPYLDSVTYKPVPDSNTRVLQLRNGQAQLIENPPYPQLPSLDSGSTEVITTPSTESDFLSLNTSKPPFDDVHFRRAFSLAIDRGSIVKAALSGNGAPVGTWMAPPILGGYQPAGVTDFDVQAAKQELAKSATPQGASLTLYYDPAASPAYATAAQIIQQNLKTIGVQVKIQGADANVISDVVDKKDFGARMALITYDIPDPGEAVAYYLATEGFDSFLPTNDVSTLYARASTEFDASARLGLYKQIDDKIADNADCIGLYTVPWTYGASTRLHGMSIANTGQFDFSKLWLDR